MNCTVGGSYAKALLSYQCDKKKKNRLKKNRFFFYAITPEAIIAVGYEPVATGRWQVVTGRGGGRSSTSDLPVLAARVSHAWCRRRRGIAPS